MHVDHHALWIDPDDGRHMILGNDGGTYITRDRMETGTYRVFTGPCERHPGASTIAGLCAMCSRTSDAVHREPRADLSTPPDGPECPPGVHSMFDPCPGGCLNDFDEIDEKEAAEEEAEAEERARRDAERGPGPADCAWGEPFACRVHCRPGQNGKGSILEPSELSGLFTTEKERGVLATVRTWC